MRKQGGKLMTPEDIISKHWDGGTLPIDPSYLAAHLGVAVEGDPRIQGNSHYEPAGSQSGGPLITYNPLETVGRQRFTIAHELAHHILGHGARDRSTPANFTLGSSDPLEVSANKFAVRLLMPKCFVYAAIQARGVRDARQLAKMFNVSESAMRHRLNELNYGLG